MTTDKVLVRVRPWGVREGDRILGTSMVRRREDSMKALCEECLRSFDLLDDHDAAEYAYGHDCEGRTEMTIKPGRYTTNRTRDWWDDPRLSDTARARAVAAALELPAGIVEIVADSDEEVDLASVWLITVGHERAIGHVTTDPDGTIVVEILDGEEIVVELKTTEDHIRAGHQVRAYWTVEQAADTHLADDGRLIVGSVYDTVADSESETGFWCATCETDTEPDPDTEIEYA